MGKTRNLFNKIRDIQGIFHTKMGTIKHRNGKDLIEVKESKRDGKNTQKNCAKKGLNYQITTMVGSLIQNQTSWSEVKWTLGSNAADKASGGDGISAELFKIL